MEIILRLKVTMNQLKTKKLCFGYFCRFVTSALTLRPRKTYVYVFRALLVFCNFQATSCRFWKLGVNLFSFTLNFEYIERDFWRLHVLICCCTANQYSEITGIFLRFQTEERVLRVNEKNLTRPPARKQKYCIFYFDAT